MTAGAVEEAPPPFRVVKMVRKSKLDLLVSAFLCNFLRSIFHTIMIWIDADKVYLIME